MAYDKYIKRNGKVYGPYTYHSRRVNGKVVSEYHGSSDSPNKNKFFGLVLPLIGAFLILVFVGYVFFNGNFNLTGQATLDLNSIAVGGNDSERSGEVLIELDSGELIPSDAKVFIEFSGDENETYEFELKDLVSEETVEGDFYLTTSTISGNGEGYGTPGKKLIYPEVEFVLEILPVGQNVKNTPEKETSETNSNNENSNNENSANSESNSNSQNESSQGNVSENNESDIIEENATSEVTGNFNGSIEEETSGTEEETIEEESPAIEETQDDTPEETSETVSDGPGNSENSQGNSGNAPGITGAVVGNSEGSSLLRFFSGIFSKIGITGNVVDSNDSPFIEEVNGVTSKDKQFEYKLQPGESVRIKEDSVFADSSFNPIDESNLVLEVNGVNVAVSTEYFEEIEGFGFEYNGNEKKQIALSLEDLGIDLKGKENETLKVMVEYQDETIFLQEKSVSDLIEEEIEIPDETPEILNETSNETVTNVTLSNQTVVNETIVEFESELVLTEDEIETLIDEFGNASVITSKAERIGDRVLVRLELGNYWIEHSYLDEGDLEDLVEKDRVAWLKQLASSLSSKDSDVEKVGDLIKDYPLNSSLIE